RCENERGHRTAPSISAKRSASRAGRISPGSALRAARGLTPRNLPRPAQYTSLLGPTIRRYAAPRKNPPRISAGGSLSETIHLVQNTVIDRTGPPNFDFAFHKWPREWSVRRTQARDIVDANAAAGKPAKVSEVR